MEKRWLTFFLVVLCITLFFQTFINPPPPPPAPAADDAATTDTLAMATPVAAVETPAAATAPSATQPVIEEEPGEIISVRTQSLAVDFNTRGAVPVSWTITDPEFLVPGAEETGVEMIPPIANTVDREYPLNFILKEAQTTRFIDAFNRRNYEVRQETGENGEVMLEFTSPVLPDGLQLVKAFTFPADGFLVDMEVRLLNRSAQQLRFDDDGMGPGIGWGPGIGGGEDAPGGIGVPRTPESAVWLTDGDTQDIERNDLDVGEMRTRSAPVQWAGVTNRYFFATIISTDSTAGVRVSAKPRNVDPEADERHGPLTIDVFQEPLTLSPQRQAVYHYQLYVGPKSRRILADLNQDLGEVFFFSSWRWFRALCLGLMWGLVHLRDHLPNYGWAIIVLTLILRLITQPFVYFSQKSSARFAQAQKKLKPEMDEINKKFKDNPQKRQEETWKLYKKHNVNPLGAMKGCVWAIVQMPFFFAFYKLLLMSIELRGANFLWIDDLAQPDRLFMLPVWFPLITAVNLLPILMTISQFLTQRLMMTTAMDPTQRQMMVIMPVFFMVIMYNMASGLVLYWFISNLWQIGSQLWINKVVRQEQAALAAGALPHAPATAPPEAAEKSKKPRKPRGGK